MKRLIDAIIAKWFTVPEWEFVRDIKVYQGNESEEAGNYPIEIRALYICKKTGKFKQIKL